MFHCLRQYCGILEGIQKCAQHIETVFRLFYACFSSNPLFLLVHLSNTPCVGTLWFRRECQPPILFLSQVDSFSTFLPPCNFVFHNRQVMVFPLFLFPFTSCWKMALHIVVSSARILSRKLLIGLRGEYGPLWHFVDKTRLKPLSPPEHLQRAYAGLPHQSGLPHLQIFKIRQILPALQKELLDRPVS